jgi:ATP-dependent Clp protease ATP-binding subunit ClpA
LREGFSEEYGERNLERMMDQLLSGRLAVEILGNGFHDREVILVSADEAHLKLERMEET